MRNVRPSVCTGQASPAVEAVRGCVRWAASCRRCSSGSRRPTVLRRQRQRRRRRSAVALGVGPPRAPSCVPRGREFRPIRTQWREISAEIAVFPPSASQTTVSRSHPESLGSGHRHPDAVGPPCAPSPVPQSLSALRAHPRPHAVTLGPPRGREFRPIRTRWREISAEVAVFPPSTSAGQDHRWRSQVRGAAVEGVGVGGSRPPLTESGRRCRQYAAKIQPMKTPDPAWSIALLGRRSQRHQTSCIAHRESCSTSPSPPSPAGPRKNAPPDARVQGCRIHTPTPRSVPERGYRARTHHEPQREHRNGGRSRHHRAHRYRIMDSE